MRKHDAREQVRAPAARLTQVTVYRDRANLGLAEANKRIGDTSGPYAIFSIVGVVRDVSAEGLGIAFEGQQLMANNVLRPGESYLLKLTVAMDRIPRDLVPLLVKDGDFHALLLKTVCRWHQPDEPTSKAGFSITDDTPPEVLRFLVGIL